MGEWIMETIIGDYIGPTIGIHSPIPYKEPDRQRRERFAPSPALSPLQDEQVIPVPEAFGV